MKAALALLLAIHGAIHLLGFVKGFELAPVIQLKEPISRPAGALWLFAALLFFASAALLYAAPGRWWLAAAPAVILSQALVIRAWTDARFGTVANAIVLVPLAVTLLQRAPWSLRAEFERAVAARPPAAVAGPSDAVTAADLVHLPAAVRRYVERAGVVGRPHVRGFEARFTGRLRNGVGSPWMEIEAEQRTTFDPPARLFFVTAARAGIPFHVFHRLTAEGATMQVRVAGLAQVVDARGPEMDRSEAVTFFNDLCVLSPGALVDAPVRWEEVDQRTVRGTFALGREAVSATLAFDEEGDLVGFTSPDRSMSADGKTFERHPWSTPLREPRVHPEQRRRSLPKNRQEPPGDSFVIPPGPGALRKARALSSRALTGMAACDTSYLMAATAMVHVRVDVKMKARAEKALSAMGLSVSDAVRVLLTRVAAEKALPFEVRVPNAATRAAMKEARQGGLKAHATVADLMADLNAED